MVSYYVESLSGERLKRCYDIAPKRVQQYLLSEIEYVSRKLKSSDVILELGCGYGRVISVLARKTKVAVGIDISLQSLVLGRKLFADISGLNFIAMDAVHLAFCDNVFDIVFCVQNGICAFGVNKRRLISEAIRVVKPGKRVLFSTYSEKFWNERMKWFEIQADAGLIGEIDYSKTKNGVIVCKDGFVATTLSEDEFLSLTENFNVDRRIVEVDNSSLFCEMIKY